MRVSRDRETNIRRIADGYWPDRRKVERFLAFGKPEADPPRAKRQ